MTADEIYSKLAGLPEPTLKRKDWPDYAALGFTEADEETLLDLIDEYHLAPEQDDEESAVSIHAWRALATQARRENLAEFITLLHATSAIDDDWYPNDFPHLLAPLGMDILPVLRELIGDDILVNSSLIDAITALPSNEEERISATEQLLPLFQKESLDRQTRSCLISAFIELKAKQMAGQIEEAFANNRVDVSLNGDWEEVQIALGLREKRETARPNFFQLENELALQERLDFLGEFPADSNPHAQMQYLLSLHATSQSLSGIDELDGFLLAAAMSPDDPPFRQIEAAVWSLGNGDEIAIPDFRDKKEAKLWRQLLKTHYETVKQGLRDDSYLPLVFPWPDAEDSMDPEAPYFSNWTDGFGRGYDVFVENPEKEEYAFINELIFEILEAEEEGIRLLEDRDDNPMFRLMDHLLASGTFATGEGGFDGLSLYESAEDIFPEPTPATPQPEKKAKINRNDPCPCGSGKKYKKCCLN
ncbi:UPF0149 family protein [Roseibacillus ishigakijimensis]|uniref:UPF0149 family protein n=1 Tax=Roseibacillus ishigakijimensis TaxID=454146 RepID=A0A934VKY0_9BACT|nr:UPF0149 family protein [Roseibacillus ishigakijimensis]MBK1832546.1 UPF0149 family protein [Roseibacillus ishigakijimensis]